MEIFLFRSLHFYRYRWTAEIKVLVKITRFFFNAP
jgi:hypothetical protein